MSEEIPTITNQPISLFGNLYVSNDETIITDSELANNKITNVFYISSIDDDDVSSPYDSTIRYYNLKLDYNNLFTEDTKTNILNLLNTSYDLNQFDKNVLIQCSEPSQYISYIIGLCYCVNFPEINNVDYLLFKQLIESKKENLSIQDNIIWYITN